MVFIRSTLAGNRSISDHENALMSSKSSPKMALGEVEVEVEKGVEEGLEAAAEAVAEGVALSSCSRRLLAHAPRYHGAKKAGTCGAHFPWSGPGTGACTGWYHGVWYHPFVLVRGRYHPFQGPGGALEVCSTEPSIRGRGTRACARTERAQVLAPKEGAIRLVHEANRVPPLGRPRGRRPRRAQGLLQ